MNEAGQHSQPRRPRTVRCAIYTRKTTEEGLEQEFNSLDAQREVGRGLHRQPEARGLGLPADRYDDGGYTGGNMDRPAFQRLLADIEAGQVDCVWSTRWTASAAPCWTSPGSWKLRASTASRFVSVTQQFNTTTSMGRLTLNILLSFAQFEREIISERTRDKIAAARRKGKWSGGMPILGYDVDPKTRYLLVNEPEAARVRDIFELYLEERTLLPVVQGARPPRLAEQARGRRARAASAAAGRSTRPACSSC